LFLPIIACTLFNKIRDKGKSFCWLSRRWRGEGRAEWVVREGVEKGGEMTQSLYAHMNNKTIKI
jgi:hypothetical protein